MHDVKKWGYDEGGTNMVACARFGVRISVLIIVALCLPKLGVLYFQSRAYLTNMPIDSSFKLGIENVTDEFLRSLTPKGDLSYTVGLVTNQTGKDLKGVRTIDILRTRGLTIKKIFVPEHGLDGTIQHHIDSGPMVDTITGIPIITLYAYNQGTTKTLDKQALRDIDVLMFDMQEVGMRHTTYLTTLFQTLETAATHNKTMVVFDRPNMLGSCMEGPLVEDGLKSAISYAAIPVRHGMTIGELAVYFNDHGMRHKARLEVVPMQNYNRHQAIPSSLDTRLSANIHNKNSCFGYSMLGLLAEVRPFDVALGTDKAFQCISLPDSVKFSQRRWYELHSLLKDHGIDAQFHRFFSPRKKQYCSGLWLHIDDMNKIAAFKSLLMVLNFFKKSGVELKFSAAFDKAVGTQKVREFLEGKMSKYELELGINGYLYEFFNKATLAFKYWPYPYVVQL
jgi:uncharacterized protein YbbC (DUF1343 family)